MRSLSNNRASPRIGASVIARIASALVGVMETTVLEKCVLNGDCFDLDTSLEERDGITEGSVVILMKRMRILGVCKLESCFCSDT